MNIEFRKYQPLPNEIKEMMRMWNDILIDGVAFPGLELYNDESFRDMLIHQTAVTCMLVDEKMVGYYILHPNNIGRCAHVANASYILDKSVRGKHLGKYLVKNSIEEAKACQFKGMQFNAVVASNHAALHIYQELGFQHIGTIPQGFLFKKRTIL